MSKRIGLMLKNMGSTSIYCNDRRVAVTLLCLEETFLLSLKTKENCGYNAAVLAYGDFSNINKPQLSFLKKKWVR